METKTHSKNSVSAICQNCKKDFAIESEDFNFYEKIKVPPPTWCHECRLIRRLMWRNERSFFFRNCGKCGEKIISIFPEESGINVFCRPCWWGDSWDASKYAMDFDPTRPFFAQLNELLRKVPLPSLFGLYSTLKNSEFSNMVGYLKNCYFVTMADWDDNCHYSSNIFHCSDCIDNSMLEDSELCYQTLNCQKCHKVFYSIDCESCLNVHFSKNLIGCSDCIGCVNLRNKQYYIFNQPYSKEEYEKLILEYKMSSRKKTSEIFQKAQSFWLRYPNRFMHGRLNNDVSGDYVYNSKNTHDAFMVPEAEDCKFIGLVTPGKITNAYDHTHYGISTDLVYETLQVGNQASNIKFSWFVLTGVIDIEYSIFCVNSSKNLFGCVGLKGKEYCILNKQYAKDEYERLRKIIIQQMKDIPFLDLAGRVYRYGEFLPTDFAPYAYNVGSAQEFFPMDEKTAQDYGFAWVSSIKNENTPTVKANEIPDGPVAEIDKLSKETYECLHKRKCNENCSGAFRVTTNELKFYMRFDLPLPDLCPNCRHYGRLKFRNPWKLWHRKCMKEGCVNEFETSYSPDSSDVVYCENCYNKEVY